MKAIVVVDENWGIGRSNDLLFSLPADMKHFRETTREKVVVMGSNTLLSFPGSKPLPKRVNIVLWPRRAQCRTGKIRLARGRSARRGMVRAGYRYHEFKLYRVRNERGKSSGHRGYFSRILYRGRGAGRAHVHDAHGRRGPHADRHVQGARLHERAHHV